MKNLRYLAIFVALVSRLSGAEPRWIRMPSADFEIFSTAGEGDTRRTLQNFERVRNFFEQVLGGKIEKADPVRIIVFGSKKEYLPYRPNEVAIAYYTQIAGRDYIVMGDTSDEVAPIAIHEYVHLVAQHAGLKFPPWLSEGMAELYSTMKPSGDKIMIGAVIPGRWQALGREKWVPLATIVGAEHDSPYYNEKDKAGSLYNEGWALTHMLELSKEYNPGFRQFLDLIQKDVPSQQALETAYKKPLSQIERDLQAYLRRDTLYASLVPAKLQNGERVPSEPASLFEVKLALLDLENRPGKEAESRRKLEELVGENPKRPEPHVGLGYLALRGGDQELGIKEFGKALDLGSQNPGMLWDFGRMAGQKEPQQAIRALNTLMGLQPNRFEVRLTLAEVQMGAKQSKLAIETLGQVHTVTPKDAPVMFRLLAYAYLQEGVSAPARANAQSWLDNTKEPADQESAKKIIQYLDNLAAAGQPLSAGQIRPVPRPVNEEGKQEEGKPATKRGQAGTARAAALDAHVAPKLFVTGTMAQLDCRGEVPKLVIQSEKGLVALLMDQPNSVILSGVTGTIEMNCGPQKPSPVRVEYDLPSESQTGVMGLVRAIHFEPLPAK